MRMRHIVACGLHRSAAFFHIIHKQHDFRKKKKALQNTKCVFWVSLQVLLETFLIVRRNERAMMNNVYLIFT